MFKPTPIQKFLLKTSFIGTFAEMMLMPIYLALANRFGGNILDAGAGFCIFNVSTGLIVFTFGQSKFFDRHAKWMVVIGFTLAGITDLMYLAINGKWEFYALQVIAGMAIGLANPAWDSVYSDEGEDQGAERWSFWTGGISFVMGAGSFLGGYIANRWGFGPLFIIMAATDAIAVYYAIQILLFDRREAELAL